jgi:hypothetical protein
VRVAVHEADAPPLRDRDDVPVSVRVAVFAELLDAVLVGLSRARVRVAVPVELGVPNALERVAVPVELGVPQCSKNEWLFQ